jgi:WD40 repeat protein
LAEVLSYIKEFQEHQAAIYALENGPTAATFFSAGSDRKVILWNILTDEYKVIAQIPAMIVSLCYLPKEEILLVGQTSGGIHVLDLSRKQEIRLLSAHKSYIFDIKYNSKTAHVYVASGDGSFSVWDANSFELIHQVQLTEEKIRKLTFSTERREIAIGCGDGKLYLLDIHDFSTKEVLENEAGVNSIAYLKDQHLVVGLKNAHLVEWDLTMYQMVNKFPAHNWAIYDLKQPEGFPYLVSASRDKTIKVWEVSTLKPLQRIQFPKSKGHTHSVNALLFLEEHDFIVTTGDDRRIKVWKVSIP